MPAQPRRLRSAPGRDASPEVEGLLGCRGTIYATAPITRLGTLETYLWSDRGGSSVTVTLVFQNKRLRSKAQRGLGAEARRGS